MINYSKDFWLLIGFGRNNREMNQSQTSKDTHETITSHVLYFVEEGNLKEP